MGERRKNILGFILFVVIMFGYVGIWSIKNNIRYNRVKKSECIEYTVSEGETIWTIARGLDAEKWDINARVGIIREINSISPYIYPGQTIRIPKIWTSTN